MSLGERESWLTYISVASWEDAEMDWHVFLPLGFKGVISPIKHYIDVKKEVQYSICIILV